MGLATVRSLNHSTKGMTMTPRILALVATMAAAGCVTAESHDPIEEQTATAGALVDVDMLGRWVSRTSGEVIDLRAGGVFVHVPATIYNSAGGTGTWHLQDYMGTQYLVTVRGGTSAQRTGARGATTLELTPGGTYDLTGAL